MYIRTFTKARVNKQKLAAEQKRKIEKGLSPHTGHCETTRSKLAEAACC